MSKPWSAAHRLGEQHIEQWLVDAYQSLGLQHIAYMSSTLHSTWLINGEVLVCNSLLM